MLKFTKLSYHKKRKNVIINSFYRLSFSLVFVIEKHYPSSNFCLPFALLPSMSKSVSRDWLDPHCHESQLEKRQHLQYSSFLFVSLLCKRFVQSNRVFKRNKTIIIITCDLFFERIKMQTKTYTTFFLVWGTVLWSWVLRNIKTLMKKQSSIIG